MEHSTMATHSFKSGMIDFTAGSLGAVALVYVGQPLDTVKVKMQAFPLMYTGMIDCIRQTIKRDGFTRGLYAGTVPALAANIAENSVLFAGYGTCQKVIAHAIGKNVNDLSAVGNATAGFLASFFSSFTLCPTELIKCQLQAAKEVRINQHKSSQGVVNVTAYQLIGKILQTDGIKGLYRGLGSTFAREMPGYFFFFGGYEGTRGFLAAPGQKKDDIGWFNTMVAGAVGGICLWTSIFPADVIKSRIQVSDVKGSMFKVGYRIIQQEGALALYSGLLPTLIRTIPATAVLFLTYEYSKKFMTQLFNSD